MRKLKVERIIMNAFRRKIVKVKRSSIVFPTNSIWSGLGSVFNVAGKYFDYHTSNSEMQSDKKALLRDWEMVGNDIKNAETYIKRENKELYVF